MATSRRRFLATAFAGAAVPVLTPRFLDRMERRLEPFAALDAAQGATNDEFWEEIGRAFRVSPDFINLENGYSSPQPEQTLEALIGQVRRINGALSPYMRRERAEEHLAVRKELAELAGCPVDELVITRNTTESMGTVIHGFPFARRDEAVMTDQDYGSMVEQFRQEARRKGIRCVTVSLPLHPADDAEIVGAYERAITSRTKLLLLTHMINVTGQILPARKISEMAHGFGVKVLIDAAHSFAHCVYDVPSLEGDYFGASLHKWLCTPLGAGVLQMRKERIPGIWPLLGETSVPPDDIRKFERLGTQPAWTVAAIPAAIRFHRMIGGSRKEARLRYLQEYWTSRAREIPGVILNTPSGERACAIANVAVAGRKPQEVAELLFERHRIFTVAIDMEAVKGVRVTPHLYTTTKDLDALVAAIRTLAGRG